MDHDWFKTRLLELQDAELPELERQQILQHAQACPSCREELERWKVTQQALSGLLKVSPSDVFVERIMSKVETSPAPQLPLCRRGFLEKLASWVPEWLYPELGLAAAAVILFFTLTSLQQVPVSTEALLLNRLPEGDQWIGLSQAADWTGSWNTLSEDA